MRTAIIIILVILLMAVVYYFLVIKGKTNTTTEGMPCSTVPGAAPNGVIKNGTCQKISGNVINGGTLPFDPNVLKQFNVGDDVFLNPNAVTPATQDAIPVYKAPLQNAAGTYLLGVVRPDWYFPNAIGKYSADAGNGFSKVSVQNLQLWKFAGKYTTIIMYVTQDVFFRNSDIQKTPY